MLLAAGAAHAAGALHARLAALAKGTWQVACVHAKVIDALLQLSKFVEDSVPILKEHSFVTPHI